MREGRLAGARLPFDEDEPAPAVPRVVQPSLQHRQLTAPADEIVLGHVPSLGSGRRSYARSAGPVGIAAGTVLYLRLNLLGLL
ncbi:hypothetical protein GCM10018783_21670 [Streptomyces griseosporeus]|nr:hypothetical protein GCM10018783_21670 [Streptomyces griseosporeus]